MTEQPNAMPPFWKATLLMVGCCGLMVLFQGCKKEEIPLKGVSRISLVNVIPDGADINYLINGSRINAQPLTFQQNTGYLTLLSNSYHLRVMQADPSGPLLDTSVQFSPGHWYSFIVYDTLKKVSAMLVQDQIPTPPPGKVNLRFLHLSPDSLAVDVYLNGIKWVSHRRFADNLKDTTLARFGLQVAGTYRVDIKKYADTLVLASMPGVVLSENGSFTLYAKGLRKRIGDRGFGVGLLVHSPHR